MIRIIEASNRYQAKLGWLQSHWLFSFSQHYDPDNIQFGPLRVYNDDFILPYSGFPTHLHKHVEIITLVLNGNITHYDSLGNKIILGPNHVHRLYAGNGIRHSELNFTDKPVHYHQIWFFPECYGEKPESEHLKFQSKDWQNQLHPVASGQGYENTLTLSTDSTIYRSELENGKTLFYDLNENRLVFMYIISGSVIINHQNLKPGDQARIISENQLTIKAKKTCSYILIDLPSNMGWGYSEKTLKGVKIKVK